MNIQRIDGSILIKDWDGKLNFDHMNLENADFSGMGLENADFSSANLYRASFRSSRLRNANFSNANLGESDFSHAFLVKANFSNAYLYHTNLIGANLEQANLVGVRFDYSSFPLWCGSFDMKVDDRLIFQLIAHITRLNISSCSRDTKKVVKSLDKWKNKFCEYRLDIEEI